jgi:fructose-bisphosphate aldolase, class I
MTFDPRRIHAEEAKRTELAVVAWPNAPGSSLSTDSDTAIDVVGYGVQIVVPLGAHVIKMKLPTAHVEQEVAGKVRGEHRIAISTPTECVRHVANRDFAGRRIVLFSGGPANLHDRKLLGGIRAIHAGEGFGSIIGGNPFRHPKEEAIRMPSAVMDIQSAVSTQDRAQ